MFVLSSVPSFCLTNIYFLFIHSFRSDLPSLVFVVVKGVDAVDGAQGKEDPGEILEGHLVVFLRVRLGIRLFIGDNETRNETEISLSKRQGERRFKTEISIR